MVKKNTSGDVPPGVGRKVKIVVLPTNVALVRPPVERLGPLHRYRPFLMEDGGPAGGLEGEEAAAAEDLHPCSAFPAGLVPRFEGELAAAGYRVAVADRRRFGDARRPLPGLAHGSRGRPDAYGPARSRTGSRAPARLGGRGQAAGGSGS